MWSGQQRQEDSPISELLIGKGFVFQILLLIRFIITRKRSSMIPSKTLVSCKENAALSHKKGKERLTSATSNESGNHKLSFS